MRTGAPGEGCPILAVSGLTRRYGGLVAVDDVSFSVAAGTALGVIGPNGAGKTTLFSMISGLEPPNAGQVLFRGAPIQRLAPHVISRLGIGRTFQSVRVFRELTLRENLRVADLYSRPGDGGDFAERSSRWLQFVGLHARAAERAEALSYGQQKLLELAMVLMAGPSVLLLDEPVAGVNPALIQEIGALLHRLIGQGLTLVVVEHNVPFVVELCHRVLVLCSGRVLAEGSGDEVQRDERVLEAFLGGR